MQNYENKKASYFATPSPQLIRALHTALTQILSRPLKERFDKHREVSDRVKAAVATLGLKQVASKPEDQAHGMTAIYLPETVKATDILPKLAKKNIVFAGGIHKEIAPKYIRFGHMGVSVVGSSIYLMVSSLLLIPNDRQLDPARGDIDRAIQALEDGLSECGYQKT
jgi:alanine-glyoxylate transaminase / serine-glyoxylate transaminase / serine-pyruvate transaminase